MSKDIEALRSRFYNDDDDPLGLGLGSSSTAGPGRSSSSTGTASSSSGTAPYPPPQNRPGTTSNSSRKGKHRESTINGSNGSGYSGQRKALPRAAAPMEVDVDVDTRLGVMRRDREESDVKKLLRAWQNERHAPDILPAKDVLLGNILDSIRRQTDDVNALRSAADLSEEDHYMMMLVQTEVERMKFVVRSYIRARLYKIEQYASYIFQSDSPDRSIEVQSRLTTAELQHATQYASLVVKHFNTAVLDHLPATQREMNDEMPLMPSMVSEPDKERPVFFCALEECGQIRLPDGTGFEIKKGSIHLMRYGTIEHLLLRDEIELV